LPSATQDNPSGRKKLSGVERLDLLCARAILAAVLAILIWAPLAYGAVEDGRQITSAPHRYGFLVVQGLVVFSLVVWAFRIYLQRPFRLLWPPVCWAVTAFVLYAIVRCRFVVVAYAARQELMQVLVYACLFFIILNNLNRRESAWAVASVLIAVGLGEALFAFYQFATHDPHVWGVLKPDQYAMRGSGTFICPDNFAGFAAMILPLALAYTVMGRLSPTIKVLTGYGALVMITGVLVSQSRGGVLAMAITLVVFCLVLIYQREYWRHGVLALGVLIVVGVVLLQSFGAVAGRFEKLYANKGDERIYYWNGAAQIFHQHFLWGAGPGHFKYLYAPFAPFLGYYGQLSPQTAHNDYLNTLCEWGLAGFALIMVTMGLLFAGVRAYWPHVKRTSNDLERKNSSKAAFVLGASLGIFAVMVHCVVDFDMHLPANALTAVTLMALLTAHWRFGTEGYWANPRRLGKALLAVTALGAAGFLTLAGWRSGLEFHWLEKAALEKTSLDQQAADFQKARQYEPLNSFSLYELGDCYLTRAFDGGPDYKDQTKAAMTWFESAMLLNPYDPMAHVRYGMCLDWLDRPREATRYFLRANELLPYNSTIYFYLGRHCMELGSYAFAAHWFEYAMIFPNGLDVRTYYNRAMERSQAAAKGVPSP